MSFLGITLMATKSLEFRWLARYTAPYPPWPSFFNTLKSSIVRFLHGFFSFLFFEFYFSKTFISQSHVNSDRLSLLEMKAFCPSFIGTLALYELSLQMDNGVDYKCSIFDSSEINYAFGEVRGEPESWRSWDIFSILFSIYLSREIIFCLR